MQQLLSSIISQTNFEGSAYQLDRIREAAREHEWDEPIEDAERAVDACLAEIEATSDGLEPDEVHPEALAFYRARLVESAEMAMPRETLVDDLTQEQREALDQIAKEIHALDPDVRHTLSKRPHEWPAELDHAEVYARKDGDNERAAQWSDLAARTRDALEGDDDG
jgi:hypothetical protein